jgi:starvation-inducible outer membrane lipoprotein
MDLKKNTMYKHVLCILFLLSSGCATEDKNIKQPTAEQAAEKAAGTCVSKK